jgi:hypothetical protein
MDERNEQSWNYAKIPIFIAILAGVLWLLWLTDGGLGICWTHNVLRNWEEFGLFSLHGQLVTNPGGFEALTHPDVYTGHRPTSLYPAWLCGLIIPWNHGGEMLYYGLMSVVVFFSIWHLLGKSEWAWWLAAIAVLCPGYIRWQTSVDPNETSALLGFPFCALVLFLLNRRTFNVGSAVILLLAIVVFTMINWTTAYVHCVLLITILTVRTVTWRRIAIYLGLSGLAAAVVLATSVISKMTGEGGHSENFLTMLQGYTWGNSGYGLDLTTKTAVQRVVAANLIGLVPFLMAVAWWGYVNRKDAAIQWVRGLFPLGAMILLLAVMRNYFGHHPWMSSAFILLGLVLGFHIWIFTATKRSEPGLLKRRSWLPVLAPVGVLLYGTIVMIFFRIHNAGEFELVSMIRHDTARADTIAVAARDPALAGIADRFPELFDRNFLVISNVASLDSLPGRKFLLSSVELPGALHLVAHSTADAISRNGLLQAPLAWYSKHIAKRNPGDKMEVPAVCYLYEPQP